MATPPKGGAGVAERMFLPAADDPVCEPSDAVILADALCRGGVSDAMHSACGK
jgi:hypothetical protein